MELGQAETKISSLSQSSKNVEITGEITELNQVREVSTRYGMTKVMNAIIQDDTGDITLVVWGDLCEKIKEGDKIKLTKAYVSEWNGKLQLNVGKFGKLIVLN